MGQTITLKVKETQGEETVVKKINHEIEEIDLWQFTKTLKCLKDILSTLQEDESVKEFFDSAFGENPSLEGIDKENAEELIKKMDEEFLMKAVGSFEALAVRLPEKAFELLSILSGIKLEVLQKQKLVDVLDIFDAVVEVNDIEKTVTRLKKSLGSTMNKLKFLRKVKEATN
jgi:hypothetical protein